MKKQPVITAVAAASENGIIGKGGTIPWRVAADFKFWQDYARGKPVIMGRKTYIDMPPSFQKRDKIIVLTRDTACNINGVQIRHTMEDALAAAHDICDRTGDQEIIIGGGGEIYKQALPYIDEIWLSTIHVTIENGDARFPNLPESDWAVAGTPEEFPRQDGDTCGFTLTHYVRR